MPQTELIMHLSSAGDKRVRLGEIRPTTEHAALVALVVGVVGKGGVRGVAGLDRPPIELGASPTSCCHGHLSDGRRRSRRRRRRHRHRPPLRLDRSSRLPCPSLRYKIRCSIVLKLSELMISLMKCVASSSLVLFYVEPIVLLVAFEPYFDRWNFRLDRRMLLACVAV